MGWLIRCCEGPMRNFVSLGSLVSADMLCSTFLARVLLFIVLLSSFRVRLGAWTMDRLVLLPTAFIAHLLEVRLCAEHWRNRGGQTHSLPSRLLMQSHQTSGRPPCKHMRNSLWTKMESQLQCYLTNLVNGYKQQNTQLIKIYAFLKNEEGLPNNLGNAPL